MRRKVTTGIYLIAFVCLICSPQLAWNLLGKHMDTTENENRVAQEKPVFRLEEYDTYADAYEGYYNDALPFRSQLVTWNSCVEYFVFRDSPNASAVIVGDDNWLFYSSVQDGDPISCYKGHQLLSEEQLQQIAFNMQQTDAYMTAQGIEFVLFIAPNKERMYSEMMPDYYGEPSDIYPALQVVQYLQENTDIRVVYPYEELMEAKRNNPKIDLYYKTDTHWNAAGGYVGSRSLLDELGIKLPDLEKLYLQPVIDTAHCDLAKMISMHEYLEDQGIDYEIEGYDKHDFIADKWDKRTEVICHSREANPRKLFVSRDSFGTAMLEVLGSQFEQSYMVYRDVYSPEMLEEQEPDIFVFEVVERYVPLLEDCVIVPQE